MAEVEIRIGGRPFMVACQPGEEAYLESAARLLDIEASALVQQLGKMPESQMLLMAGLMLADKTAGLEERLRAVPAAPGPALPDDLAERLEALAERAEAVAREVEERVTGA
jgi:cell division protein ZapA